MRNAHAGIPDRLTAHNRRYASEWADVLRLRSLLALGGVELDLLVLVQRPVAGCRDRGEVDEHVRRPVIGGDETKALVGVEPLHCSCCHQFKSSVRHATTRSAAPTASLPVLAVEPGPAPVVVFRTSGGRGEDSGHEPCKAAGTPGLRRPLRLDDRPAGTGRTWNTTIRSARRPARRDTRLGAGTGAKLPHFRNASRVVAAEPDPAMRRRMAAKLPG